MQQKEIKLDIKVEVYTQSGSSSIVFRCSWNLQIDARFAEWRVTRELEENAWSKKENQKKSPPTPEFEDEPDFWPGEKSRSDPATAL